MRCEGNLAEGVKASSVCCSNLRLVGRLRFAGFFVSVEPVQASSGMRKGIDLKSLLRSPATLFNGRVCGDPVFCRLNQNCFIKNTLPWRHLRREQ